MRLLGEAFLRSILKMESSPASKFIGAFLNSTDPIGAIDLRNTKYDPHF